MSDTAKQLGLDTAAEFERAYAQERDELLVMRMRLMTVVGAVMFATFWLLDWLVAPTRAPELGVIRAAMCVFLIVLRLLTTPGRRYIALGGQIAAVASTRCAGLMMARTGHFSSLYVLGVAQTFIIMGYFAPLSMTRATVTLAAMVASVFLANFGAIRWAPDVIGVAFGLGGIAVLTHLTMWSSEEARRASLRVRVVALERHERLATIGRMTSSIVHDINNPLSTVTLSASLLLESAPSRDDAEAAQMILDASQRIHRMVRDIKDYASLGEIALERQPTSLGALVADIAATEGPRLASAGVRLSIEIEAGAERPAALDRERIRRVLENLLGNAREALHSREQADKHIAIRLRGDADGVELQLHDNGPGIPDEVRARLFLPFVTAGKPHGTGLGLSIARSLVAAHGGRLTLEPPSPAGGACFVLWLPLAATEG